MLLVVDATELSRTAADNEVRSAIILTLRASLWATLAALVLGVPLAWILARHKFPGRRVLEGIIDLPVIIPHTAAGIALLSVWGRQSLFHRFTGVTVVGTEAGISLAMFFVSVPFLVNAAKSGFRLVDERYEKTARSLGAGPWKTFFSVSLPMVRKSILSGSIMMLGRGISEFGAVVILAYHPMTAPVMIFERFQNFGLQYALPVTVLLILISLLVFIGLRLVEERRR
ncbi:MAG: ABC transporter permease [Candidatus Aminicenantes bacterium]|nr:ABC transporter permease [Candidatus Aminicenantes bacterium]